MGVFQLWWSVDGAFLDGPWCAPGRPGPSCDGTLPTRNPGLPDRAGPHASQPARATDPRSSLCAHRHAMRLPAKTASAYIPHPVAPRDSYAGSPRPPLIPFAAPDTATPQVRDTLRSGKAVSVRLYIGS